MKKYAKPEFVSELLESLDVITASGEVAQDSTYDDAYVDQSSIFGIL